VWNFMDLTPEGRPDWNVGLDDHGPKEAKPALLAAAGGALISPLAGEKAISAS
jgi:hypothetical protein